MTNLPLSRRKARESAVQFLYQSERDKTFYFQASAFEEFCENFNVGHDAREYARDLAKGVSDRQSEIDAIISGAAQNWSIDRFGSTDRCVARVAVLELLVGDVPYRVIINEAVDLAKTYGTENSGRFINGLLDKVAKERGVS